MSQAKCQVVGGVSKWVSRITNCVNADDMLALLAAPGQSGAQGQPDKHAGDKHKGGVSKKDKKAKKKAKKEAKNNGGGKGGDSEAKKAKKAAKKAKKAKKKKNKTLGLDVSA